ncbi:MAG: PaaI family thioesterase [Chloroflexota bacterium]
MTRKRQRTIQWDNPLVAAAAAKTICGLDFLRAIRDGDYPPPPIAQTLDFALQEVEDGMVVFKCEAAEFHYNPIGSMHGGVMATLCDSAMGCAVHTTLPKGKGYSTVELKVNLLRPIFSQTGRLRCTGTVIHAGRRIATAEAKLTDDVDKLYAHATTTCLLFDMV